MYSKVQWRKQRALPLTCLLLLVGRPVQSLNFCCRRILKDKAFDFIERIAFEKTDSALFVTNSEVAPMLRELQRRGLRVDSRLDDFVHLILYSVHLN